MVIPKSVKKMGKAGLEITWADGIINNYTFAELRKSCQCATCVNEHTGKKILDITKIPDDIKIIKIEVVGNYALQFLFSDSHNTGIYPFDLLRSLTLKDESASPPVST